MRIHRIRLKDFRGVGDTEVTLSPSGVTIIEGDNEVGKTSLFDAVDLLFALFDDSTHKSIRAIKPVGRDVGSEVEVELSSGPYHLRYRKRWNKDRLTELEVLEPVHEQLTGREAHQRVEAIVDETLDTNLWEALRFRQGGDVGQVGFADTSLGRALDAAAGGDVTGDREDDLWTRIKEERDRYWTASGKQNTMLTTAAKDHDAAKERVSQLERELAELEHDTGQVERLETGIADLVEKRTVLENDLIDLEEKLESITKLRSRVVQLGDTKKTAEAQHDLAAGAAADRAALVKKVAHDTAEVERLEGLRDASQGELVKAAERHQSAQNAFDDGQRRLKEAQAAVRRAQEDLEFRRDELSLEQLTGRRDRAAEAIAQRERSEEILGGINVDADLLDEMEAADRALVEAQIRAQAGAVIVRASAESDVIIDMDGDQISLGAGDEHERSIVGHGEITLPGVVRLSVEAGADAAALADLVTAAEEHLTSLCERGRVEDLEAARTAAASALSAQQQLAAAQDTIDRDLGDLSFESLEHKVEGLKERTRSFMGDRATEPPLPVDFDAAQAAEKSAIRILDDEHTAIEQLSEDRDRAARAIQDLKISRATVDGHIEGARSELSRSTSALAAAREKSGDDMLARAEKEAAEGLSRRSAELEEAEDALSAEDPETTETLLDNAREAKKRLGENIRTNETQIIELRSRLATKGEEGLTDQFQKAQAELLRLESEFERLSAQAEAAKLLHDTFEARRAEARQRYAAPFRERVEQLGRLVFGKTFSVQLDDDLRISERTVDGVSVPFDSLSTGAKEQLGVLCRLACASLVSDEGGAPVVFDDALGWSDGRRLERMGAAISSASADSQVIVLTCSPARYAGVGKAKVISFEG